MTESLPAELGSTFVFCCPKKPSKADQNSVVALSKARFVESSVADVTAAVMGAWHAAASCVHGRAHARASVGSSTHVRAHGAFRTPPRADGRRVA